MRAPCAWFAACPRDADGCVDHPVLGWVPTCRPCADKLDLDLVEGDVTIDPASPSARPETDSEYAKRLLAEHTGVVR